MPRPLTRDITNYRNFFSNFNNFDIELTDHAKQRMQQHGVTLADLRRVLRRGTVLRVEPEIRTGDDKYRVAGTDVDNRPIEVVVVLETTGDGSVVVVTVIDPRPRERRRGGRRPLGKQRREEGSGSREP